MTYVRYIDQALDQIQAAHPGFEEFDARTIADTLGIATSWASTMLQNHRKAQKYGKTKWIVACRQYGPGAKWYVLAAPGRSKRGTGLTLGQADHIVADVRERVLSDLDHEISPAVLQHPVIAGAMPKLIADIDAAVRGLVSNVEWMTDLIGQANNVQPDRRSVSV